MSISGWRWLDGHSMLVMSATSGLKMWVVDIALHDLFSGEQTMVLDFKGFLGAVLLESCSVHFGYTECVPFIGLHFPPECVPSIGLHFSCIQSNDFSYTVFVCQLSSPMICPTWSKYLRHAFWEPSMQICCSVIAVSSIGWAVSTSHIFIEEPEGLFS